MVWVVDGKDRWDWHPIERRLDLTTDFKGYGADLPLLEAFQKGPEWIWIETSQPPSPDVVRGQQVVKVELKPQSPPDQVLMDVDMDPKTDLPVRYMYDHKDSKPHPITGYKDIKFDPVIDPALFKFVPEVKPNSWDPLDYMLKPGAKMPDFTGQLLGSNGKFRLATALKHSKAILVDMLQMGCQPCWDELKSSLEGLHERYASKGFNVVGVGLGPEDQVKEWVGDAHLRLPMVLGDTCQMDMMSVYRVGVSGTLYLIGSKGIVRARYTEAKLATIERDLAQLGVSD